MREPRSTHVGGGWLGTWTISTVESCDSDDRVNNAIRAMMVCAKSASSLMTSYLLCAVWHVHNG